MEPESEKAVVTVGDSLTNIPEGLGSSFAVEQKQDASLKNVMKQWGEIQHC